MTPLVLFGLLLAGVAGLLALPGCDNPVAQPGPSKAFEGEELTLSCADAAFADAITPIVKAWEVRTGAKVRLSREAMTPTDETDVGIIPVGGLGEWAEPGLLTPVPDELRASNHPFQWFALLPAYSGRLITWGGQTLAVPLTGDGYVIVYRADRFADKAADAEYQKRHPRGLGSPATWDEFADIALFFAARDMKPSLPPLPTDPERLFDLFSRVASSADRRALTDVEIAQQTTRESLAFHFTIEKGVPRLNSFGFQQAAAWLERLRPALATVPPGGTDDPVAALAENRAVLAVVSLDQLARLPRENGVVPPRFALAGVPGTRTYFNPEAGKPVSDVTANYVPYFAGGRLGVVRSRCQNRAAAFDLLADIGSPARGAEFIATPGLGAGPTRISHLDRDRLILWLSYGFDEERTKSLQDAMRHYVGQTVKNPTFGLRGPDRAALVAAAAEPLRAIDARPKPLTAQSAINQAEAAWRALDAKVPEATRIRWRQRAAGESSK